LYSSNEKYTEKKKRRTKNSSSSIQTVKYQTNAAEHLSYSLLRTDLLGQDRVSAHDKDWCSLVTPNSLMKIWILTVPQKQKLFSDIVDGRCLVTCIPTMLMKQSPDCLLGSDPVDLSLPTF
jgi:hypothetical protein